jgi:hypothetical protein
MGRGKNSECRTLDIEGSGASGRAGIMGNSMFGVGR